MKVFKVWVPFSKVIQEIEVLNVMDFQKELSLSTQILKNNFSSISWY